MTTLSLLRHLLFCSGLALFSAGVVRIMIGARVLDQPDSRKAHVQPVPKGGGVGVVAAFLCGMMALYALAEFSRIAEPYFVAVIVAAAAMAAVAFVDDLRDWPFTIKLGAQLAASAVVVGSGLVISSVNLPVLGPISLGWLGFPLTLGWLLFATNAMNFIDGLNGLASGVSIITCAALAAVAAAHGGWFVYFASLLLAAGLLGFLPFNFPNARIFMGDVGSQFCGFVLAVLAVVAGRFQGVELSILLVPMLLFGILFDVAFTLMRRALAGERVTEAHRSHLYQIAHRAGMSPVWVTLVHWAFAAWGALCCALFLAGSGPLKPLAALLVLPPQLLWLRYVVRRARESSIGRW